MRNFLLFCIFGVVQLSLTQFYICKINEMIADFSVRKRAKGGEKLGIHCEISALKAALTLKTTLSILVLKTLWSSFVRRHQ